MSINTNSSSVPIERRNFGVYRFCGPQRWTKFGCGLPDLSYFGQARLLFSAAQLLLSRQVWATHSVLKKFYLRQPPIARTQNVRRLSRRSARQIARSIWRQVVSHRWNHLTRVIHRHHSGIRVPWSSSADFKTGKTARTIILSVVLYESIT